MKSLFQSLENVAAWSSNHWKRRVAVGVLAAAATIPVAMAVDVFIITGQSNSLGTTALEGAALDPGSDPADAVIRILWANVSAANTTYPAVLYGSSGGAFLPLQMQQGDGGANTNFWGPEFGFSRTLFAAGRTNFIIIKACRGGGGNTYWDKGAFETNANSGHMWGQLRDTVTNALASLAASGTPFNVRGFIYIQGESNSSNEAVIAGTRFQLLASNVAALINAQFPGAADGMKFIIGEFAADQATTVRQIGISNQIAVAYADESIAYVETRDLPLKSDSLHFGRNAKLEIGRRIANAVLGCPMIYSAGFSAVTNAGDATTLIFERYVPDTNGTANGVNFQTNGTFRGFTDGANGQSRAGMFVDGSTGRVVFADYYSSFTTSDIAAGGDAANANSGPIVFFKFADPTNEDSAVVSSVGFEISAALQGDNVHLEIFDAGGRLLYNSGVYTADGRYGYEARVPFTETLTSCVQRLALVGGASNQLWTVGHVSDGGVPDFAWRNWRVLSPCERWGFSIADPAQRSDFADPDGDGIANLAEYAGGSSPTNTNTSSLSAVFTNGAFALRFNRATNSTDITFIVEAADALTNGAPWNLIAQKNHEVAWTGSALITETNSEAIAVVLAKDTITNASQRYMRIRMTHP